MATVMTAQFRAWLASRIAQQPVVCGAALCVLLVAATAIVDTAVFGARSRRVDSVEALQKFYRELGYVEPAVAAGKTDVPRVYLSHIPPWWRHIHPIATKKSVFFRALLPLVLTVNEDIARDRRRLQRIAAAYRATGSAGDGRGAPSAVRRAAVSRSA